MSGADSRYRTVVDRAISMKVTGLSAVTLAIHDMSRAVIFYQALGFEMLHGGHSADFTSFAVGSSYLNLIVVEKSTSIA